VDSFADLFDGFYYTFSSKPDKFDNLRSIMMKILNTPATQKRPGIRTKRLEYEQNLQTKKGAISRPSTELEEDLGEGENGCFGREWMVKFLVRKRKKEDTIIGNNLKFPI